MGSLKYMTQLFGLPAAASGPHPYRRSDGANAIVYRDTSGRIQELSFKPGVFGWTLTELTASAGRSGLPALTDPILYVRADGVSAVLYLDFNSQHLFELDLDTAWFRTGHTNDLGRDRLHGAPRARPTRSTSAHGPGRRDRLGALGWNDGGGVPRPARGRHGTHLSDSVPRTGPGSTTPRPPMT